MATRKQQALMKVVRTCFTEAKSKPARVNAGGWQRQATPYTSPGYRIAFDNDAESVRVYYDDGKPDVLFSLFDWAKSKNVCDAYLSILKKCGLSVEFIRVENRKRPYLKVTQVSEEQTA